MRYYFVIREYQGEFFTSLVVVEASGLTLLELTDTATAAVVDAILDVVVVDAAASILSAMIDLLCSVLWEWSNKINLLKDIQIYQ